MANTTVKPKSLQIIEPMIGGHHTNYLLALIPAVLKLRQQGIIHSIVFTVTPAHLSVLKELEEVRYAGDAIRWDDSLIEISPGPTTKERYALYRSIRATVDTCRPDAAICTSADYDIIPNALSNRFADATFWPEKSAAVVHAGFPKGNLNGKEELKRLIYESTWKLSKWDKVLIVNPLVFRSLQQRGKTNSGRFRLLPDPVPARPMLTRLQAREALGLPTDGFYIGCVGMMDRRKAIPELLAAFATSGLANEARLLLMGRLDEHYMEIIYSDYNDLVSRRSIILMNHLLTDEELMNGYAAIDLHSVLQYRRANLSANVLKCVAFKRPFVSDQLGFGSMIANDFNAGVLCDVEDVGSIITALKAGIDMAGKYYESEARSRLIEFHSYSNFSTTALSSVLGAGVHDCLGAPLCSSYAYS